MNDKVFISAALSGASSVGDHIPLTPEAMAKDAVECVKAGASILHIHVRNPENTAMPTMDRKVWRDHFEAIKEACMKEGLQPIINFSSANGPASDEERVAHLMDIQPEMCSMDTGSLNWGPFLWENTPAFLDKLADVTLKYDIRPEIELMDTCMVNNAIRMIKKGKIKTPAYFQLVMGTGSGIDGSLENINWLLSKLPEGSLWSITGIGHNHMRCMLAGLAAGADGIRVGLEDNVYYAKGVQTTNVKLVERAARLIELSGRKVATVDETREILKITRKCW